MGEPYIDTLEDADGTKMYPITKAEAVYLPDNARLDEVVVRKSNRPLDPSVPLIPIDAGTLDGHGVEYFATAEEESSSQGRNLIPYPYYRPDSYVHNGITFTVNDDGSVTANGTATANAYILLCGRGLSKGLKLKKDKTYTLGAAPEGASSDTYYIYINCNTSQGGATNVYYIAYDEPVTFKPVNAYEPETVGLTIYIKKDVVADNLTFYPMLEEGSVAHKYEPTKESNVSLVDSLKTLYNPTSLDDINVNRVVSAYDRTEFGGNWALLDNRILTDSSGKNYPGFQSQIAMNIKTGKVYKRCQYNGTWTDWKELVDADSLNAVKTKQESYKMGALINIKTYTTDNYTCPNDGYAYVINNSGNTGHILIGNSISIGGSEGKFSAYVKKGMTLKVYGTVASAYFSPITNT